MKTAGVQFHEGVPESDHLKAWFPNVLDGLMVEGGEDKALLDLFTKHSYHHNIPGKYAKTISKNTHYIEGF